MLTGQDQPTQLWSNKIILIIITLASPAPLNRRSVLTSEALGLCTCTVYIIIINQEIGLFLQCLIKEKGSRTARLMFCLIDAILNLQ